MDAFAGADWLGFHVLRKGEMLPEWLDLARDIERDEHTLAAIREQFVALVRLTGDSDDWVENAESLKQSIEEFTERGRRLRTKQDRFNLMAPGPATQRPGIWVEQKRRQLVEVMRDCGAPDWAIEGACA